MWVISFSPGICLIFISLCRLYVSYFKLKSSIVKFVQFVLKLCVWLHLHKLLQIDKEFIACIYHLDAWKNGLCTQWVWSWLGTVEKITLAMVVKFFGFFFFLNHFVKGFWNLIIKSSWCKLFCVTFLERRTYFKL